MIFNVSGLILNILGVLLISIYSLYDYGLQCANRFWQEDESLKNQEIFKKIDHKIKNREKFTPLEKEQLIELLKDAFTYHVSIYVVNLWLFINKNVFFFHPWVEEKPREVNRFLWNFIGLFLILLGFIFQLIDNFLK